MNNKKLPVTSRVSWKPYECECGYEREVQTNHWGEVYDHCPCCRNLVAWKCNETPPAGYGVPEKWKIVKLSDVAEVIGEWIEQKEAS